MDLILLLGLIKLQEKGANMRKKVISISS